MATLDDLVKELRELRREVKRLHEDGARREVLPVYVPAPIYAPVLPCTPPSPFYPPFDVRC
jgi:hypothetical protein